MSRPATAYPPRGLRRDEAARYIGIGVTKFDQLVTAGRMPQPRRVDGCVIWDRVQLDTAFDALAEDDPPPSANEWDEVLGH